MINNIIRIYHDEVGHVGIDKTMQGILNMYWFPCMKQHVTEYIQNCVKYMIVNIPSSKLEGKL